MKKKSYLFKALVLNPIILIIYGTGCYYLVQLAFLGGISRRAPVILTSFALLLVWFLSCLILFFKYRDEEKNSLFTASGWINKISEWWYFAALLIFTTITIMTGYRVHFASVPYQGELAWFIEEYQNSKDIAFEHNNIYEDGLDGLLEDIEKELELPEALYMSDDFRLNFNSAGEITAINTFLYGKDADQETQTFLISYDKETSDEINVRIKGFLNDTYDEAKKLEPLISTVRAVSLKDLVSEWSAEEMGIHYTGYHDWGSNSEGIYILDPSDYPVPSETVESEYAGYTVSVFVPYQEDSITPKRIINTDYQLPENYKNMDEETEFTVGYSEKDGIQSYFLDNNVGFQMPIIESAAGSHYYALEKTTSGGTTWERINLSVFNDSGGSASGLVFFDELLGFAGLALNGGAEAELYRTEDGGFTFTKVAFPEVEVELSNDVSSIPYDYPGMPYLIGEQMFMLVGQGSDGDYNGGDELKYVSNDKGKTWQVYDEE